ncbi:glutamate--tRNA ligase [Actinobacteria bacterium YIM 96077]|uniref:Glutamate--tRNA ligase n=1 Tax=Phytoactinopolyspora halophila TaxID=1981511 RepID=A0A329QPH9_9ACTN|nr:glutamate--tRNA ligase [Phytoactinopolyspora halophila]AYY12548.1 glutamate--tRNA ligase [Actinobacteria bacterium YIM 96077]RAW12548.1 glutamate--tRNA ligase [Phytoactinopolyspora halophila]
MTDSASSSNTFVLGEVAPKDVRVRFCPSPTGNPHVGLVRAALYNWAFARHFGGTFVFRIEDTDATRDTEESYEALLATLRWLGLDWDEGPEAGGEYGPYRQSERFDIYADVANRLLDAGYAYRCYCTPEELEERRAAARAAGKPSGYDGTCRDLSADQIAAYEAEGRESVLRMRTPDDTVTFTDLIRGEISVDPDNLFDFVLVRANGHPLYTLVNPVDDALMRITHVLRGEDLLSSTPRQLIVHEAVRELGIASGPMPRFAHLPLVTGEGGKKLSKREPESSLQLYLDRGFLREGLLNYLALLGWSIGDDREVFSMEEMAEAFDVTQVNPSAARFDIKKAEAINGAWMRQLNVDELAERMVPHLQEAGLLDHPPEPESMEILRAAAPLVQERMTVLDECVGMLGFLFVSEDAFQIDETDAAKVLNGESKQVLEAARSALGTLETWTLDAIEEALRTALVDELGLKPRLAFGPVRVAVTGRRVSPPLFESLVLLGRERTLSRIDSALVRAEVG